MYFRLDYSLFKIRRGAAKGGGEEEKMRGEEEKRTTVAQEKEKREKKNFFLALALNWKTGLPGQQSAIFLDWRLKPAC